MSGDNKTGCVVAFFVALVIVSFIWAIAFYRTHAAEEQRQVRIAKVHACQSDSCVQAVGG